MPNWPRPGRSSPSARTASRTPRTGKASPTRSTCSSADRATLTLVGRSTRPRWLRLTHPRALLEPCHRRSGACLIPAGHLAPLSHLAAAAGSPMNRLLPRSALRFEAKKNAASRAAFFCAERRVRLLAAHPRLQRVDHATDAIGIALGTDFAAGAARVDRQHDRVACALGRGWSALGILVVLAAAEHAAEQARTGFRTARLGGDLVGVIGVVVGDHVA